MTDLFQRAREIQAEFDKLGLANCIIGGLAVQVWGRTRATTDVDFTVLAPIGDEAQLIDRVLGLLEPRINGVKEFALVNRILLVQSSDGIKVDVGIGGFALEEEFVERSEFVEIVDGVTLRVCCAEDLVIMKCIANRAIDLEDVNSILARQYGKVDLDRIRFVLSGVAEGTENYAGVEGFEKSVELVERSMRELRGEEPFAD